MNCKKCGKKMPDGARFCTFCGAEHDSNGNLIVKNNHVDYNKTVMANDMPVQSGHIDYNKTVMANDVPRSSGIDYNKTMMANDVPHNNIDYNKTMMASDSPLNNNYSNAKRNPIPNNVNVKNKKKKKISPVVFIVLILLIAAIVVKVVLMKQEANKASKSSNTSQSETTSAPKTNGNVVTDFNDASGYWSKDAEFFYKDGTIQKNQWVGDYYLGSDGRKVRNQLIDDTYYVDATGKKVTNQWYKFTKKINGKNMTVWYYLGEDGAKLKNTLTPDGYYVNADGIYIPGEENYITSTTAPNYSTKKN